MRTVAIIPARGGSKGVPLKNIRMMAGRPLIEYTISSAKNSKKIDRIIVSTDDKKIAQISKSLGAEVPFLRPKVLAQDDSSSINVIKHALQFLLINQSYTPDIILILQPTSPFRTTEVIGRSIEMLKKSKEATSVISVSKIKTHPYNAFWYNTKYLKPFNDNFQKYSQRQKVPSLYYPTGSIFTFWNKTLKKYHSIYGPRIKPIIEEHSIDIDTTFDFFISEMKMLHWKKYQKKFDS